MTPQLKDSRFKDKLVLITGASAGIGSQTAVDFAALGARLILTARRVERLSQVVDKIRSNGGEATAYPCDLADSNARDQLIARVKEQHGIPDVIVNNAGYGNYRLFLKETYEDISRMMEVNYTAAAHLMTGFLSDMVQRGSGAVVNVSSGAGKVAMPFMASYCASKFALCALTEAVSYEMTGTSVTVHLINPGPVDTEFFDAGVWEGIPSESKAKAADVSKSIQNAIINNKLISYVPPKRGLMVYIFNLLGPVGRIMVRRKFK